MKFKYYIMLLGVLLMASCNKGIDVGDPSNFDVTTDNTTYKVGEEIKFTFTGGSVNNIAFYSGESLKDYDYRDGRVVNVSDSSATVAFQSSVQFGTQVNQLSVLASTDFTGDYSSLVTVKAATWTDITSWFALGTGTAFLASGTKDIASLKVAGKPIYFAFKYLTKPQAANGFVRTYFIQVFSIISNAKLDSTITLTISDQANAGFRIVDENKENAPARSSVTSTRVTLAGNRALYSNDPLFDPANIIYDPLNPIYDPYSPTYIPTAVRPTFVPFDTTSVYNDPLSEHWAVSRAINLESVNLGPDWSTSLKGVTTANMTEYSYKYAKAGTYKVVFVAANNSIDNVKQVVRELPLTITKE